MECLQVSPCMGWMSADPERRARTTKREQELSQAAEELVNEQKGLNSDQRDPRGQFLGHLGSFWSHVSENG